MELIKRHINNSLNQLLSETSSTFSEIFASIQNEGKVEYKHLLKYLDNLLNKVFLGSSQELKPLHIHFENDFDDSINLLIAEYLLIRYFKQYLLNDEGSIEVNSKLIQLKQNQESKQRMLALCPDGASGKNGGNRLFKNWITQKNNIKELLNFYQAINENKLFYPNSIFNCQIKTKSKLIDLFITKPFAIDIENYEITKSYCLLNSEKGLNELDKYENLIDNMDGLILFDCERKKMMSNFTFEDINKWNSEFGTVFKQYLILTFGKDVHSFNNIRIKIDSIKERFKIPIETAYTILSSEVDILLNRDDKLNIPIEFVGFETSSFWDTFHLETSIRELYELRSIKLMNIYSLSLTEEIKNYILEDLFSKSETSELISINTKQALLELRDDDINYIKEALGHVLDLIINSEIKDKINKQLDNVPTIILDESIVRNQKLIEKISKALALTRSIKLKTWSDIPRITSNSIIILSYRDQGKYPNFYFPNLIEFEFSNEKTASAILPNFLFGQHYNWSKYYILKDYHKYLFHPTRQNHFDWNQLKSTIQALRPESKLNIDWNLEYEFSNTDQRETYKIKIKDQRVKTFNSSDLFIVKIGENLNYQVVKMDYLLSLDITDGKYFIQNLDEIQEDINIYDKIADTKQQEEELNIIRNKFKLGDESAGRLWKILLKNIADSKGEDNLYNDLRIHLEKKGLKIVSLFHFKNSWINPQSESIAPLSKRIFIELCEYLNIPKIYFVIIQRIRNASKQSSRQSTRQMNQLLKDLFNDGCFNQGNNSREIINVKLSHYKMNHPLDELGIDENYLLENLVTLTELIQPELKLLELETIEKIDQ